MIRRAPFLLIKHIMSELGTWQWSERSLQARAALVQFMKTMANQVWGASHPLYAVLQALQADMNSGAVPLVVRLLAKTFAEHMQAEVEQRLDVQNHLGDSLFHVGDMDGAATIYSEIIQCSASVGETHKSVRRAM